MEQFWRFYSHMIRPGDLTGHSDFHLFKEGIKPMWEVNRLADILYLLWLFGYAWKAWSEIVYV